MGKDTVLITLPVFRRAWHIQQDQMRILGLVKDNTIELHSSVHPPDVGLVPREGWYSGQHSGLEACSLPSPPILFKYARKGSTNHLRSGVG